MKKTERLFVFDRNFDINYTFWKVDALRLQYIHKFLPVEVLGDYIVFSIHFYFCYDFSLLYLDCTPSIGQVIKQHYLKLTPPQIQLG